MSAKLRSQTLITYKSGKRMTSLSVSLQMEPV